MRIVTLAMVLASAPPPADAPAVQRPTVQRPSASEAVPGVPERAEPPEAPEAPATNEAPEPVETAPPQQLPVDAVAETPPTPSLALEGSGDAWVDVLVLNGLNDRPRPGIRVSLWCDDCNIQPGFKVSPPGGVATFRGVRAGRYTVVAYAPGGPIEGQVDVAANERVGVRLSLPRDPYTPKNDKGRLNYPGISTNPAKRRAQIPLAVGGVLLTAGVGLSVGALVEGLVPDCRYGNDNCDGPPRDDVTRSLAIGAAVTGALGIAGITIGAINLRRWRYGVSADSDSASFVVSGRF